MNVHVTKLLSPAFSKKMEGDIVFGFPWSVVRGAWYVVPSL